MSILIISPSHALYPQVLDLRQRILRDPIGLNIYDEDLEAEKDQVVLIAEANGIVTGCTMLQHYDAGAFKLRQMAVDSSCQGKGIGKQLLQAAATYASNMGKHTIILHARDTAVSFYKNAGYHTIGSPFIEVGIPHIKMEKKL